MTKTSRSLLKEDRPGVLLYGGARMALLDVKDGFWGLRRQIEALVGCHLTNVVFQQAGANGGASFARAFAGHGGGAQALRDCVAAYQAAGFGQFEIDLIEWPVGRVLVRARRAFEAWAVRQHGGLSEVWSASSAPARRKALRRVCSSCSRPGRRAMSPSLPLLRTLLSADRSTCWNGSLTACRWASP